jgi:hypothetical protein
MQERWTTTNTWRGPTNDNANREGTTNDNAGTTDVNAHMEGQGADENGEGMTNDSAGTTNTNAGQRTPTRNNECQHGTMNDEVDNNE